MGADLYINSIYEKNRKTFEPFFNAAVKKRDAATDENKKAHYQKMVSKYCDLMYSEGYFRDSYNGSSILSLIGLSWWQDVIPLCKDGILNKKGAIKLYNLIKDRPVPKITHDFLVKKHLDTTESLESWQEYFQSKYIDLLDFLELSIETNQPIEASL